MNKTNVKLLIFGNEQQRTIKKKGSRGTKPRLPFFP